MYIFRCIYLSCVEKAVERNHERALLSQPNACCLYTVQHLRSSVQFWAFLGKITMGWGGARGIQT